MKPVGPVYLNAVSGATAPATFPEGFESLWPWPLMEPWLFAAQFLHAVPFSAVIQKEVALKLSNC